MPPKRGQNYTERVNKRRRAVDSSAYFRLIVAATSIVASASSENAAQATTQLTLSATLTNSISAAVSEALLNVAQPAICSSSSNDIPSRISFTICSSGSSPGGAVCSGYHSTLKFRR